MAEVRWAQTQDRRQPGSPPTHAKEAAHLAQGPAAPWVVDEANVALCGAVDFPDPNGPEALLEGLPDICPEPVAYRQAHRVCPVLWVLQGHPKDEDQSPSLKEEGLSHLGVTLESYGI